MRAFAVLLLLVLVPVCAKAQGDIHRCIGADGIPVFTDRACADVNAKPALPAPASTAGAPASASTFQPPAVTCATDVEQLKQAVIDAFDDRKPNRLAGLMLWSGDEKDAAVADIRLFTRLMVHPLLDVQSVPAASSSASGNNDADASQLSLSASPDQTPAHGEALIVQTQSDDGSGAGEQTRFDVVHRSGCVWLQLQG